MVNPMPPALFLPSLQYGMSLVNPPPHGDYSQAPLPDWSESNGLLNHLAYLSGSDRPRKFLGIGASKTDVEELKNYGIDFIGIFKTHLFYPEHGEKMDKWLPAYASPVYIDEDFSLWKL